jgi:hypothetical protein
MSSTNFDFFSLFCFGIFERQNSGNAARIERFLDKIRVPPHRGGGTENGFSSLAVLRRGLLLALAAGTGGAVLARIAAAAAVLLVGAQGQHH